MQQTDQIKMISDCDGGGDDLQNIMVALGQGIAVLGVTTTFGNTSEPSVYENLRRALKFLKSDNISLCRGASAPTGRDEPLLGDGAHPVIKFLDESDLTAHNNKNAVDFILDTLKANPENTIHITASGPLTNIKQALEREPDTMMRVKRLVIMGGCTQAMKAADGTSRRGNITPHAEFNFQQAAADAKSVLESQLPMTLLPMNCTHQLTFTPERHKEILEIFKQDQYVLRALLGTEAIQNGEVKPHDAGSLDRGILNAPADLDMSKFGIDPVMHDVNCALYLLHPDQYETRRGRIKVSLHEGELTSDNMWGSTQGYSQFIPDNTSNLEVAIAIRNVDYLFWVVAQSFKNVLGA